MLNLFKSLHFLFTLFQSGRVDERRFQSTPEERLSIVGGKRAPQFYMPSYEAEIPENQKKDSEYVTCCTFYPHTYYKFVKYVHTCI